MKFTLNPLTRQLLWQKLRTPFWRGRGWQVLSWLAPIVVGLLSPYVASLINVLQAREV
ncbi:MAG: hypothetical protein ACXW1C_05705 [Gallionella sp.]